MRPRTSAYPTGTTEYHREWRKANPDKVHTARRKYRKTHPRSKAASDARRYARNATRAKALSAAYRKANPAKLRIKDQAYAKAQPAIRRAIGLRRRARKENAPGRGISASQFQELIVGSLGLCSYCGERAALEVDHIEPLSKGGAHDVDNAAPACRPCNSTKSDTPLLLWLATRKARVA